MKRMLPIAIKSIITLLILLVSLSLTPESKADFIYTYTGPTFNSGVYTRITGTITLPAPLAPGSYYLADTVPGLTYSFTDGITLFTGTASDAVAYGGCIDITISDGTNQPAWNIALVKRPGSWGSVGDIEYIIQTQTLSSGLAYDFTNTLVWDGMPLTFIHSIAWASVDGQGTWTPGLTSPVPEPATMLLLGSGLVGLVGFRKKLRKV